MLLGYSPPVLELVAKLGVVDRCDGWRCGVRPERRRSRSSSSSLLQIPIAPAVLPWVMPWLSTSSTPTTGEPLRAAHLPPSFHLLRVNGVVWWAALVAATAVAAPGMVLADPSGGAPHGVVVANPSDAAVALSGVVLAAQPWWCTTMARERDQGRRRREER